MSLKVRPARPDEIDACAALYERVARETFDWIDPQAITAAQVVEAAVEEEIHVVVEAGRLLGFAAFYRPDDFLHSLFVEKDARGRGVGSMLLAHVQGLTEAPVTLKVQKLNQVALDFYARRGLLPYEDGGADEPGGGWFRLRPAR